MPAGLFLEGVYRPFALIRRQKTSEMIHPGPFSLNGNTSSVQRGVGKLFHVKKSTLGPPTNPMLAEGQAP